MTLTPAIIARFWSKVVRRADNECWGWSASTRGVGYGAFKIEGTTYDAHRIAFQITNGPIPEGKLVIHSCDNRGCCNPAHLRLGTHQDNAIEAVDRGRMKAPGCGRLTRLEPLTDAELLSLLDEHDRGVGRLALARKYKVPPTSMFRVLRKAEEVKQAGGTSASGAA